MILDQLVVYFDVRLRPYTGWHLAVTPLLLSLVAFAVAYARSREGVPPRIDWVRRISWAAFTVCITLAAVLVVTTKAEHSSLRRSLDQGDFQLAEGEVTDLVPGGKNGHPRERFRIAGTSFSYAASEMTAAFHQPVGAGGPLRNGIPVRIFAVNGKIARLEVPRAVIK